MIKAKKPVKKTKVKKPKKPKKTEEVAPKIVPLQPEKYFEAVGRRKTAVARVRLFTRGGKAFFVNEKPINLYFPSSELQQVAQAALEKMKCLDKFRILTKVKGGGLPSQAEAIRHGTARGLVLFNPDFRKRLKKAGFLTRDPRMRERKKFGLKRARRAPQWSKR
jgi:small subunit ribosomal protein S9